MSFTGAWRALVPEALRRRYAAKLAVALVGVVLLTVAVGVVVHVQTDTQLRAGVDEELSSTAAVRADTLDTWMYSVKDQAVVTSRHSAVTGGDVGEVKRYLDWLFDRGLLPADVAAVHYYDTANKEIVTSTADPMIGVSPAEQGAPFATDPPEFSDPDDTAVTDPFEVPVVDHPVVAVVTPVPGVEDRAIVYMIDITKQANRLAGSSDTQTLVVDGDGEFVAHPETGQITEAFAAADAVLTGERFAQRDGQVMAAASMTATDWTVVTRTPATAAYGLASDVTSGVLGLILVTVIGLAIVGVTVGSNTVISLRRLAERADAMAAGDLDVPMETRREDELGTVVRSFDAMRDSLRETIADAEAARGEAERARADAEASARALEATAADYEDAMRAVADGDLTRRVDPDADSDAMRAVGEAFNGTVSALESTLADVKRFAGHVVDAAETADENAEAVAERTASVAQTVREISAGADDQAEHLHSVEREMSGLSASAEEVAATVESVAQTSSRAADAGEDGQDTAQEALSEMDAVRDRTDETMTELEALDDEVAEIGQIAEVIADIAEQTNLLALNASIEAARTGAEGDGFAVVADEVKALAEETKASAEEVEARIERVQDRTDDTVGEMRETGERVTDGVATVEGAIESLSTVAGHVEEIDDDIREIERATEQQARSVDSVVSMVEEVAAIGDQTTAEADRVAAATDDQADSIADVDEAATDLAARARRLRGLLGEFDVQAGATVDATVRTPTEADD